jgi:Nif-specific regulatory protein
MFHSGTRVAEPRITMLHPPESTNSPSDDWTLVFMKRGRTFFPSGYRSAYDALVSLYLNEDTSTRVDPVAALTQERDFYRRLLDLGTQVEIEPFLADVLGLMVEVTDAKRGYIEIQDDWPGMQPLTFSVAKGCSLEDVATIQKAISSGVIAEALATGETVVVASALEDSRFRNRTSVRRNRIEAVICAPIGVDPPNGVLYLQDRHAPGPFSEDDRVRAETFARYLTAFTDRLLLRRRRREETNPTRPFREKLQAQSVIGRSVALARMLKQTSLAAPLDVGVLLTGASGTGKSQIARVIHDSGPRAGNAFVELNCATIPEALLESELFGALPGAHSTAARKMDGKVASAEGGTLFLDEIGELQLSAQAKLLQLLQSKEYYPLGGTKPVKADVRIIAATNADLKDLVAKRRFREDLYYRLQVLPIVIPTLAERREDIGDLAEYFCARAVEEHRLPHLRFSLSALRAAMAAEWPGNIRELAHAVEAAVIRASGDMVLEIERHHVFPDKPSSKEEKLTFQAATRRFQEQMLRAALEEANWNIVETAERLDLTRSHIYNLIRAFGIVRERS